MATVSLPFRYWMLAEKSSGIVRLGAGELRSAENHLLDWEGQQARLPCSNATIASPGSYFPEVPPDSGGTRFRFGRVPSTKDLFAFTSPGNLTTSLSFSSSLK